LVARVQFSRVRGAVAMDDRRERASGGVEAGGHVAVSLRIAREVARREQLVESFRRLDRVEPVALVDGGALPNGPTPPPSLPNAPRVAPAGRGSAHRTSCRRARRRSSGAPG